MKLFPAVRSAYRKQLHAMICNMFFDPVEAVPLKHTSTRLNFRRLDTGACVSFARSDVGESVFVEYFVPYPSPNDEMKTLKVPAAVSAWVKTHCGLRVPCHAPGMFANYSTSKTSSCWGQPNGGISIPGFRIAVCQPSPRHVGDPAGFYFDFIAS